MKSDNPTKTALMGAKASLRKSGGKKKIKVPRVIPISSKIGGILPLIPIFAGLSALGSLAGGAASIARAVKNTKAAHDTATVGGRLGTATGTASRTAAIGNGLYLKPYKTGMGIQMSKN